MGTRGYAPDVARRLRIVNITAYAAASTTIGYAIFYASYDFGELWLVVLVNLCSFVLCLLVPLLHRAGAYVGGLSFALGFFVILVALSHLLGAETGIPLFLLLTPAVAVLFFGAEKLRLTVPLSLLRTGIYLVIRFLYADGRAAIALEPELLEGIHVFSTLSFAAILVVIVYYAFQQLSRAEAAAEREFQRSEGLLRNILPASVADRLKENPDKVIADGVGEATVLFADIVNFTPMASRLAPGGVVSLLNRVFSEFDALSDRYDLEKIKTIGDAYMVAGGLPIFRADHASAVAYMALDMLSAVQQMNEGEEALGVRIGVHSGPVVAGVIGTRKFTYDVWGDTVNLAARLESNGEPGKIHVSAATHSLLKDHFIFEARGEIDVKGKGPVTTYFLIGRQEAPRHPAIGSEITP